MAPLETKGDFRTQPPENPAIHIGIALFNSYALLASLILAATSSDTGRIPSW